MGIAAPVRSPGARRHETTYNRMTTIVQYDDRGVPFFAWLLRLARNVAIDHLRANRLTPTENVIDPGSGSGVDFDHAETVRAALAAPPTSSGK